MSESSESFAGMEAYRQEKSGNCLSEAREAADLINEKMGSSDRAIVAFGDAYGTMNNIAENDANLLMAENIVNSFVTAAQTNGERIVKDISQDDRILGVEPHVRGMRNAAREEPLGYYRLALNAAQTNYQLLREGKEGGNSEALMARIARLNAAVLELEGK